LSPRPALGEPSLDPDWRPTPDPGHGAAPSTARFRSRIRSRDGPTRAPAPALRGVTSSTRRPSRAPRLSVSAAREGTSSRPRRRLRWWRWRWWRRRWRRRWQQQPRTTAAAATVPSATTAAAAAGARSRVAGSSSAARPAFESAIYRAAPAPGTRVSRHDTDNPLKPRPRPSQPISAHPGTIQTQCIAVRRLGLSRPVDLRPWPRLRLREREGGGASRRGSFSTPCSLAPSRSDATPCSPHLSPDSRLNRLQLMWPNSLGGGGGGCGGAAAATELGGLAAAAAAASSTSATDLFGPAGFGPGAAGPYGPLKSSPYVGALGMPPIEALHSSIGYPGCSPAGESYYCE
jgi:hypothetical protein